MNNADKKEFYTLLDGLAEIHDKKMGAAKKEMYFKSLEDIDMAIIRRNASKRHKFMPVPFNLAGDDGPAETAYPVWRGIEGDRCSKEKALENIKKTKLLVSGIKPILGKDTPQRHLR